MRRKKFNPWIFAIMFFMFVFILHSHLMAQADVAVPDFNPMDYIPAKYKPWILLGLGCYELATRLFPTVKNWSISGFMIRLYQKVIPNRNAETPSKPHP